MWGFTAPGHHMQVMVTELDRRIMRVGVDTRVPAKCVLKFYRISQ